jgi:hypothetical protein
LGERELDYQGWRRRLGGKREKESLVYERKRGGERRRCEVSLNYGKERGGKEERKELGQRKVRL